MRVVWCLLAQLVFQFSSLPASGSIESHQQTTPRPAPQISDDWKAILGPQEATEEYDASERHEMMVSLAALRVPTKAWRLYEKGIDAQRRSDFEAALRDFDAALKVHPAFAAAYEARGTTLLWQMKLTESSEAFRKAIALDPLMFEAELGLGLVMNGTGRFQEAIEHLQKALSLNGECWQVRYALGRAHYGLGENQKAEINLKLARTWKPDHPNLYLLLAVVLLDENKTSESVSEMETFLNASPDDPIAPQIRAKIEELRGKAE